MSLASKCLEQFDLERRLRGHVADLSLYFTYFSHLLLLTIEKLMYFGLFFIEISQHSRRTSDLSSSSSSESSSSDEDEPESRRSKSRSKRAKKERKHKSRRHKHSSSDSEGDGPLPLSRFFGNVKS